MSLRPCGAAVLVAATFALGTFTSRPARAAACCTSAAVFGVGRLLVWEDAAAGVRLGAARGVGQWLGKGDWRDYPATYADDELRAEAWGLVRISEKFQGFVRAPLLLNVRSSGHLAESGGGLSDLQAGVRWEVVGVGEYLELPAFALTLAGLAPTGTRAEAAPTPLGTAGTGRGAFEASLAFELERTWGLWYARLEGGARLSFPFTRPDTGATQRYGPGFTAAISGGRAVYEDKLVLGLLVQHVREGVLLVEDVEIPASEARVTSAAFAASFRFSPHWTAQGSISTGFFASGLGANKPGQHTLSLGFRHGWF